MSLRSRKRQFIDKTVQGQLVLRVVSYWALCMLGIFFILAGTPIVLNWFISASRAPTTGQLILQSWRMFWPAFFASGLVLPFLLLDVIRISHRFVGPVHRLRNSLRDMADGKRVVPIKFRDNDFWYEMAEELNRVAARLQELESANQQSPLRNKGSTADTQEAGSVAL